MKVALVRRSECVPKKPGSSQCRQSIGRPVGRTVASLWAVQTPTAAEEELARLLVGGLAVDCLSGMLRHLEPDRLADLLPVHGRPIDRLTKRRSVLDLQVS